ncbi:MAG: hypothetical protein ACI3VR_08070 [Intestinibacter sp.]|uniref:hypothetical protein n=1 Tax=Intestinibacter sp. TaxID=1965304 RepID=UPI003F163D7D
MKFVNKKIVSIFLALAITISSFAILGTTEVDAATSSLKTLKANTTYTYNLDGKGSSEKIKFTRSAINSTDYKIKLYINGKYVTSVQEWHYGSYPSKEVRIFDFYSKDSSKEIYMKGENSSKIVKYNKGKYTIKTISGASDIKSYNSSTGIVKIPRWINDNVLMSCISEYKVSGYSITKQPINYGINPDMLTIRYKALKDIKAYKKPNSSTVAFTIKKGNIVYATATYSKDSKKYIRFETSSGKIGWVKVSSVTNVPTSMFKNIGYPRY